MNTHFNFNIEVSAPNTKKSIYLFLICIIEFIIILSIIPISYAGNDDTVMNAISSGAISGKPSEFILFTNIIIGYFLKFLFTELPQLNWYTYYLVFSLIIGYIAIQDVLSRISLNVSAKITIHLIVLSLICPSLLGLQFTKIAAIVEAAGFLLLFTSNKKDIFRYVYGVFLIILGSLIRVEVFYMYIILSAPFFVLIRNNKTKQYKSILLAIMISFSFVFFNNYQYNRNKDFKEYFEFNRLRSSITTHDNPSFTYENYKVLLDSLGWTYSDFDVASNFNLDLGHQKFNQNTLTQIVEHINKANNKFNPLVISKKLIYTINSLIDYFNNHFHYYLSIFSLLLFLLLLNRKKNLAFIITYSIYILLITWTITVFIDGNLKERVIWSLILPLNVTTIFVFFASQNTRNKNNEQRKNTRLILLYGFLIFTSLTVNARYFRGALILNSKERFYRDKMVAEYLKSQPLVFYASWCDLSKYNPFNLPYPQYQQYSLGWLAGSPFNKEKLEKYTGDNNIGIYNIFNKDIVWFFRNNSFYNDSKFHEKVTTFYKSNYKNITINHEKIPITKNDTLYKYTFFIPSN